MPGAGKSTVSVLLAKLLGYNFVDSDLLIQVRNEASLQSILEQHGYERLRTMEEEVLLDVELDQVLLATGGSAVYSEASMQRLRGTGPVVFIDVPLEVLRERVDNEDSRGIASAPGQDFADVYRERLPLYQRQATMRVSGDGQSAEAVARLIASNLA